MSKFCGIISHPRDSESKFPPPCTFEQLENTFDNLLRETEEMETDINRKIAYVTEREIQCAQNQALLHKLETELNDLARNLSVIDEEISKNEQEIQRIDQISSTIAYNEDITSGSVPTKYQSDYATKLQNVESLNAKMGTLINEKQAIDEYLKAQNALPSTENSINMITSILSLHVDALTNTERNLEQLDKRCIAVEESVQLFKQTELQLFDDK